MSNHIREYRRLAGLTQEELGGMIGQTKRVISSWEREESAVPLEDAVRCAMALHVTLDELAGNPSHGLMLATDEMELLYNYRACGPLRKNMLLLSSRDYAEGEKKTDAENGEAACTHPAKDAGVA